jgi:hypothetical protein
MKLILNDYFILAVVALSSILGFTTLFNVVDTQFFGLIDWLSMLTFSIIIGSVSSILLMSILAKPKGEASVFCHQL